MILLDAFALVALVLGESAASAVHTLTRSSETGIGTVNLAETVDVLIRLKRVPAEQCRKTVEPLLGTAIATVAFEERHAWRAAEIRSTHYHRTRRPLSLGDCALLAVAEPSDGIATADKHVLAAATAEGIHAIELPRPKRR